MARIRDHADGEIARLAFQESQFGANLDWTIDTIIHSGLVLGMAVTAGGQLLQWGGVFSPVGVTLSALFARYPPPRLPAGPRAGRGPKVLPPHPPPYPLFPRLLPPPWPSPSP